RILVTHYPVCLANGAPENRAHYLRDLADLLRVATDGGICLWLHGHRHQPYAFTEACVAPFPVICAGSATQAGRWSYCDYGYEEGHWHVLRRVYSPEERCFRDGEKFEVRLKEAGRVTSETGARGTEY